MNKLLHLLLCVALVLSLVSCGSASSSTGTASQPAVPVEHGLKTAVTSTDKVTIRLAYDCSETHPSHMATIEKFQQALQGATNGNITVELYPNSQLGSLAENMESIRLGDLEMAYLTDPTLAAAVPEFNLVGLPYLWTSIDAAHEALDGDFGKHLDKLMLEKVGLKNLGHADVGFRNITNSTRTIKTPADLKALKIRTMTNTLHVEYFTHLGAIPTPMSFSELFTALQQKTVDGQENPTAMIFNNGIYEVQKYMSITEHVWTTCPLIVSDKFFNSLPKDYQDLVSEAATNTIAYQRKLITEQNSSLADSIAKSGVAVTELTPEEKSVFQKAAAESVYVTAAAKYGQELIDMASAHNK